MLLIEGGRVVDPQSGLDEPLDILIIDDKIARLGCGLRDAMGLSPEGRPVPGVRIVDAKGKIVAPGLVDIHVHLRDPGQEYKEDIESGTRAACAGGFTSVACMPNTDPPIDNGGLVRYVKERARDFGYSNVYVIGCITKGRKGEALAEIGEMVREGVAAISDDGSSVRSAEVLRCAMLYARQFGIPVICHCEDADLSGKGVMNMGKTATLLGLRGIPAESEEVVVFRDIMLSRMTGCHLHVAHVSTKGSVNIIRKAKEEGLKVTAEVTPHHLCFTEDLVKDLDYHTATKVNPPLRTAEDVEALREGLKDGTIDCIASDHAPHAREEKEVEYDYAPFGICGLETAFGLIWTNLVQRGVLSVSQAIALMSQRPAHVLGLGKGSLREGGDADIVVIDPDLEWTVKSSEFHSKGKNTFLDGYRMKGKVVLTVVEGSIRHAEPGFLPFLPW
ncbi:MAG TPA: dihydroorotase [Clostridia bacterium]|nr:dihydroorotase [Clostridia bacterium]